MEDMEFFQFHPTGIYKLGILITEGVRGEGGVLINGLGERFMEKYAPKVKDLASRDVISRAMYLEMQAGRGINGQRYLYLDVRPETVNKYAALDGRKRLDGSPYIMTGEEIIAKLPDIVDFARTYLGVDPVTQPMPVQPTAHYTMGGIPTNKYAEVVIDEQNTVMPGLYAAGEVACVSVHGANRLGTNSLLDLIVFGKFAGLRAAEYANGADFQSLPADPAEYARAQFDADPQRTGQRKYPADCLDHEDDHDRSRWNVPHRRGDGSSANHDTGIASAPPAYPPDRSGQDFQHRHHEHLGAWQPAATLLKWSLPAPWHAPKAAVGMPAMIIRNGTMLTGSGTL